MYVQGILRFIQRIDEGVDTVSTHRAYTQGVHTGCTYRDYINLYR